MFVCLSVCSLCVPTPLDRMQRNFPERVTTSRERSTSTFFRKKNEPYRCYRQSIKLTNRIAAFQKSRKPDSEGGRRPSERSSATIHMIRVPVAMLCLLPTELTNRIAAYQKSELLDSEGGGRPSEHSSARDHMRRVPVVMRSLLHATYMTDQ